jgi:hypothetical protein
VPATGVIIVQHLLGILDPDCLLVPLDGTTRADRARMDGEAGMPASSTT